MTALSALFAILHLFSVLFMIFILWRLYSYIGRHRFSEGKYTLLFGFVHMRWFVWLYGFFVTTWIGFSYYFFALV